MLRMSRRRNPLMQIRFYRRRRSFGIAFNCCSKGLSRGMLGVVLIVWSLSHAQVYGQPKDVVSKEPGPKYADRFIEKTQQYLDRRISVDYRASCLQDAVEYLREKTSLGFVYDTSMLQQLGLLYPEGSAPPAYAAVQLQCSQMPARLALQRFLNIYGVTFVVLEDAVLITTQEEGMARLLRQKVNVNVKDMPLSRVLQDLARERSMSIIQDPREASSFGTPVTVQMDDVNLDTAVRILAELGNLKSVRIGTALFVTDKARAFELHQEDQFLNPATAVPFLVPGVVTPPNAARAVAPPQRK